MDASSAPGSHHGATLRPVVGRVGFFTLAFGAMVGSGWVIVLGEWLAGAGPGGTVVGLLAGGLAIGLVAACYGELAARAPRAGGEFLYALRTLGPRAGFVVGWFTTLYALSICTFEGIALGWFAQILFPALAEQRLYESLGSPVTTAGLAIAIAATIAIVVIHRLGARAAVGAQNLVTLVFLAFSAALVAIAVWRGDGVNAEPLFASSGSASWTLGALSVFGMCAFFMNGFQAALHGIEERRAETSVATVVAAMLVAVAVAALFYCAIVIAASFAAPWAWTIGQPLPAAAAFGRLPGWAWLSTATLVIAAISLMKTWSAMMLVASRLLYAQAANGLAPRFLARIDPARGVPTTALWIVAGVSALGAFAGRSAVLAIVNMCSICMALSFIVCLVVLLAERRRSTAVAAYRVPGGTATICLALAAVTTMAGIAIVAPAIAQGRVPLEWWLLLAWSLLGAVVWRLRTLGSGAAGALRRGVV